MGGSIGVSPGRQSPLAVVVCGAVAVTGVLAGCTGHSTGQRSMRTAGPSASPSPIVAAREAVIQSYTGYWPTWVQAAKLPRTAARAMLEPYTTPGYLAKELAG